MRIHPLLLLAIAALPLTGAAQDLREIRSRALASIASGPKNEVIPGKILVRLRPSVAAQLQAQKQGGPQAASIAIDEIVPNGTYRSRVAETGWTVWDVPMVTNVRSLAASLRKNPEVFAAQPLNRVYPLLADPNDLDWTSWEDSPDYIFSFEEDIQPYRRLWNLVDVRAHEAWSIWPGTYYTAASKPASVPTIAIIDTGADLDHPDYANSLGTSTDSAFGGQIWKAKSVRFELGEIVPGDAVDLNGHGTHVAGLAIASANNGGFAGHGMIGTGYNTRGMILRVFNDAGLATDLDAASAIYYAADNGADIINLSLGTTNFSQLFQDAVTYAWQKGLLVVAAGNENGSGGGDLGPIYPAANSGALAVTAAGPDMMPATGTYAGYGSYIDLSAPGGDVTLDPLLRWYKIQFVWSTASRDPLTTLHLNEVLFPPYEVNYAYLAGTSMASPQVAGAAGLYYGKNNLRKGNWNNVRTYRALQASAASVMGAPYGSWEYYQGYGSLDMEALLMDVNARAASVGAMEGIVYYNGTPLANVSIRAKKPTGTVTFSTTTRADGGYRFEALPPGEYRVWTAPFGALKEKYVTVQAASDFSGFDFWAGTYTGDETKPVLGRFDGFSNSSTTVNFNHWAYDTETGIDSMVARMGTVPDGDNILADRRLYQENSAVSIPGLSIPTFYHFRTQYTNGAGMTTTRRISRVPVVIDATVSAAAPTTNFGSATINQLGGTTARRIYFVVDTSGVAGDLDSVILTLQARLTGPSTGADVTVTPTSSTWNERTITWNTMPALGTRSIAMVRTTATSFAPLRINLTNYLRAKRLAGQNRVGFALQTTSPVGVEFYSREHPTKPRLEVITTQ